MADMGVGPARRRRAVVRTPMVLGASAMLAGGFPASAAAAAEGSPGGGEGLRAEGVHRAG
ncbi:hypothetical protein ADK60_16540 [Streptomyces sp. XY431]|nr:hypothetical protein ADK60_16540 [Streptomyces sp. XY431]